MEAVPNSKFISKLVKQALRTVILKAFPTVKGDAIQIQNAPKNQFDYVSPAALKQFNVNKDKTTKTSLGCKDVPQFAKKIVDSLHQNQIISSLNFNQQGFLQISLKQSLIEEQVNQILQSLDYPQIQKQTITVDFSSPNIAKQMHVGHLRSTIIGESICRVFEYMGHNVVRSNHVGDWGTQFGMLIAYMKETFPDYQTKMPEIKDLDEYYKAARKRFDSDPQFKKISQQTVVKLQAYDQSCIKAWKSICQVSRAYFETIYQRLGITLKQYGESFYNPFIPAMVEQLNKKGLIVEDDTVTQKWNKKDEKKEGKGKQKKQEKKVQQEQQAAEEEEELPKGDGRKAKCLFIEKYPIPLIVVKKDGGFNYDTTDLACIQYRIQTLKADRLVYITDSGQRQHFQMIFEAAKKAGWITHQKPQHMGFGVVLGQDKKRLKTRQGKAVKLMQLITESKQKAIIQLKSREKDEDDKGENVKQAQFTSLKAQQFEDAAEKLGIASIKYYDLKQNRLSDYVFDFNKMLDPKGNTAIYLIYAYVRICSIIRKSGLSDGQIQQLSKKKPFKISHPDQKILAAMLIKFFDVINEAAEQLMINKITDYIYEIAVKIQENYKKYKIVGNQHMQTRLMLCLALKKVLEKSFHMVGIIPIQKI